MSDTAEEARQGIKPQAAGDLSSDVRLALFRLDLLDKKFDKLMDSLSTSYASKGEVEELRKRLGSVQEGINWVIKIVLGAVIVALLGLVVYKGGVH